MTPPAFGSVLHVPTFAPAAFTQSPVQHCPSVEQMSPATVQNDGFVQTPLLHQPDAHCPFVVHGLPSTGFVVKGVQVPPPDPFGAHVWLQHSPLWPHAKLSATHCWLPHVPLMHEPVQQSGPTLQACPGSLQAPPTGAPHFFVVLSQFALQHSVLVVHAVVSVLHVGASARLPSRILLMK
jgi:hypothetical protein